jgi:hypothetical protein
VIPPCGLLIFSVRALSFGCLCRGCSRKRIQNRELAAVALRPAQSTGPPQGRLYLSDLLQIAKSEVDIEGHISVNTAKRVSMAFGLWDQSFADACSAFSANGPDTEPSTGGDDEEALKERSLILDAIDTRIEMVKLSEKRAETRYILTEPRRLSLPASDVINKIIRDESPASPRRKYTSFPRRLTEFESNSCWEQRNYLLPLSRFRRLYPAATSISLVRSPCANSERRSLSQVVSVLRIRLSDLAFLWTWSRHRL